MSLGSETLRTQETDSDGLASQLLVHPGFSVGTHTLAYISCLSEQFFS